MSGGHFDYKQYELDEIANQLDELINRKDESFFKFSDKVVSDMNKTANSLRLAAVYLQRIDWLVSGDDSEESYHKRLAEDIENFKDIQGRKISSSILMSLLGDADEVEKWWSSLNTAFNMTPSEMWKQDKEKVKKYLIDQVQR